MSPKHHSGQTQKPQCVITLRSQLLKEYTVCNVDRLKTQMAEEFSGARGARRADHRAKARLSTAEVAIRGSKELLGRGGGGVHSISRFLSVTQTRQVTGDQGSLLRELQATIMCN